jgi:hypothetical protein
MSTTTAKLPDSTYWIRPWYSGGVDITATGWGPMVIVGHLYPDCDDLLRVEADPREGAGWLDPRKPGTCQPCLHRYDPKLYVEIFGDEGEEGLSS